MTVQQVREAAKRLYGCTQLMISHDIRDVDVLTDFIMEHFPEDGEERVTEEWLREEWGFAPSHIGEGVYFPEKPLLYYKKQGSVLSLGGARVFESPTRHQARQLFQALGIKKRGEQ